MELDDFLDKFNLLGRGQGFLWSLLSWLPFRRSHKGRKTGSWSIAGGVREIRVDRSITTGGEAERLLKKAQIEIAGRRITSKEAIFIVKARQASWAEYLLLRGGAAIGPGHRWIDPENVRRASRHEAPVPLWSDKQRAGQER